MADLLGRLIDVFRLDLMLQLGLAVILGGAVGLERELGGKPAGLRTNILICMGSVLYTKLSIALGVAGDHSRVAAQIVTGVGFIGAGTILHARGAVVGLTSAATIWVVAAVGVALGAGLTLEAVGTTLLVIVVLQGLGRIERVVERQSLVRRITIHAKPETQTTEEIETVVRRAGVDVVHQESRRENVDLVVELELRGAKRLQDQVMVALLHHPSVRTVSRGE